MHPSFMAESESAPRLKAWQGAVALVLVGIGAQILGGLVALVAMVVESVAQDRPFAEMMMSGELSFAVIGPSLVATGAGMAGGALIVALAARVPVRSALGIRPAPWPAFVVAPIGILALGPTSDLLRRIMVEIAPTLTLGTLDQLDSAVRSAPLWLVAPLFSLVPGIAEELLFRGAFQRSIRTGWLAVLLSGFFFAAYHTDPHHVVAVLPLGFYLAWLGHRTGSVLVPITAHVANNATAVITAVLFADGTETPTALGEDVWWVPLGWLVAALAILVVWWTTRRPPASPPAPATF